MENELVQIERHGTHVVMVTPKGEIHDISLIPAILAAFEAEFNQGVRTFILNFDHLQELLPSMVALVFELTGRARRYGGDVCITNLHEKARHNLLHFNPEIYLLITETDRDAIDVLTRESTSDYEIKQSLETETATNDKITENGVYEIEIPSRVDALYRTCDFVTDIAQQLGYAENEISKIKISVYEACLNAIEHAYHSDTTRRVRVQVMKSSDQLTIVIIDEGDGFKVNAGEDFDVIAAAAARSTGGMGLHIIRRSMDEVRYERDAEKGNQLIMTKKLPQTSGYVDVKSQIHDAKWQE